jgi:hypothetical protein
MPECFSIFFFKKNFGYILYANKFGMSSHFTYIFFSIFNHVQSIRYMKWKKIILFRELSFSRESLKTVPNVASLESASNGAKNVKPIP